VATVTGVTLQKMQEIKNDTIISARVENGILYFKKGDDLTEFNVGKIILPAIDAWPVGSIFMSVSPTNPKILLGVSSESPVTWVRWGQGRMPISLDSSNTRFDTVEEVGGAQSVTLGLNEIPSHNHGGNTGYQSHDHSHGGYTSIDGSHSHNYFAPAVDQGAVGGSSIYRSRVATVTDAQGAHQHSVQTYGVDTNHYHSITAQGGGAAHENMPPYITVYMWKRTV